MTVAISAKALTRRGWTEYNDIRINEDETLGYNPLTRRLEWTLILNVYSFIDSELWSISNGVWKVEASKSQWWLTDSDAPVQTFEIEPTTRVLTHVPSADIDVPINLARRRQFVTNLLIEPSSTGIAWNISTGTGYWYMNQNDNIAVVKGFDP